MPLIKKMLKSYFDKNLIEAGCDEAGRGCLAGPVYAASVILPKNYKNKWLDDVCDHMVKWTFEKCHQLSLECGTRNEFKNK